MLASVATPASRSGWQGDAPAGERIARDRSDYARRHGRAHLDRGRANSLLPFATGAAPSSAAASVTSRLRYESGAAEDRKGRLPGAAAEVVVGGHGRFAGALGTHIGECDEAWGELGTEWLEEHEVGDSVVQLEHTPATIVLWGTYRAARRHFTAVRRLMRSTRNAPTAPRPSFATWACSLPGGETGTNRHGRFVPPTKIRACLSPAGHQLLAAG